MRGNKAAAQLTFKVYRQGSLVEEKRIARDVIKVGQLSSASSVRSTWAVVSFERVPLKPGVGARAGRRSPFSQGGAAFVNRPNSTM